ncbi:MAG: DUF389 domain-containing protein [Fuerstiella sp.]
MALRFIQIFLPGEHTDESHELLEGREVPARWRDQDSGQTVLHLLVPSIAVRTSTGFGDLLLALAAGTAGTLAFTRGQAGAVIGVMVAVALVLWLSKIGFTQ